MRNSLPTPNPILRSQKNYSASPDVRLPPPPLPLSGMHACVMCKVRCDAELAWFAEQFCWNRHHNVYYECRIETGRKPNAAPACSAPRARIGRRSEHHSSLERVWRGNLVGSTSVNILTERPSKPHLARNLHACTHRTTYESGSLPAQSHPAQLCPQAAILPQKRNLSLPIIRPILNGSLALRCKI
jgi:hypothetical protein